MIIYNKNKGGNDWPKLNSIIYKRTCFVINKKPFYWANYAQLLPDSNGWCIIQQIAEKNWATVGVVNDLFELGCFLFPNHDFLETRECIDLILKNKSI